MLHMIPMPKVCHMSTETLTLSATISKNDIFPTAQKTLTEFAARIQGIHFIPSDAEAGVVFTLDENLPAEGYTLTATDKQVTLTAATAEGAQNGVSTLLQIMQACGDGFTVPSGSICDAPDCSWRGVMIDLARDWHELHVLYEYVDMCRFFKIRYLHLHFTDDQSYTLPSRAFPALSTQGRHYTEEELKGLIAYADDRSVEIIPEIDVPGHCTSFAESYGDIFGRDGIICQSETSMKAMEALFTELCELFASSTYIHVGGDEAAIEKWTNCPATMEAFRAKGVDVDRMDKHELAQIMYATFVARMCHTVTACGKTPVVWEGFGESVNHLIPDNVVVMSWENFYQTTPSLQKAGFRLVNCSWAPMYVVTPVAHWPLEEVYNWSVFSWRPVHPASPYINTGLVIEPTDQVEGGQLLAWGDHIMKNYPHVAEGVRAEQRLIEERVPALSENTWNREKVSDFAEFSKRYQGVMERYAALRRD